MSNSDKEELVPLRFTYEDPNQAIENQRHKDWFTILIDGATAVQKSLEEKGVLSHVLDVIVLGYGQADVCVQGKLGVNAVKQACASQTMDIQFEGTDSDVLVRFWPEKKAFLEHMKESYKTSFYNLSPSGHQFRRDRYASFEKALKTQVLRC